MIKGVKNIVPRRYAINDVINDRFMKKNCKKHMKNNLG